MYKESVNDFPADSGSSSRHYSVLKLSSGPHASSSSRVSVLSSVVPYLRRQDADEIPANQKPALLTLNLSSSSFLDSLVYDDVTEQPLYIIRTTGPTTTIKRADPWDGDTKTAEIKWPNGLPAKGKNVSDGVSIQMRGVRYQGSETLLRRGTILSAPRKFNIPNYSHNLKWRRVGNSYWCTTAAVKGPIAIFDTAINSDPPKLYIFETLHDRNDARPMLVHHGVSLLLLDYLLVTALLLVTDLQEWTLMKKWNGNDLNIPHGSLQSIPGLTPPRSVPGNNSTSDLQWRKIMYGEPLYPKRSSHSSMSSQSASPDGLPRTPTSMEEMAKVANGHPLYRSSSPQPSISDSAEHHDMFFSPIRTRPPSPSSESIFYPLSTGSAPSHTYLDPSFYNDQADIPPVPQLPTRYNAARESGSSREFSSGSSREYSSSSSREYSSSSSRAYSSSSRPSSSHSTTSSRLLRELPIPPVPLPIPRPQSTPPRPMTSPTTTQERQDKFGIRRLPEPRRPTRLLPQPPLPVRVDSVLSNTNMGTPRIGRSRSHSLSQQKKWSPQYSKRMLPSPPSGSSSAGGGGGPGDGSSGGRRILKEAEDDLWVHSFTSSGGTVPLPLPSAAFDMPPPAYSSINFAPNPVPPPPPLAAAVSAASSEC